jgi:hypothetical protein
MGYLFAALSRATRMGINGITRRHRRDRGRAGRMDRMEASGAGECTRPNPWIA